MVLSRGTMRFDGHRVILCVKATVCTTIFPLGIAGTIFDFTTVPILVPTRTRVLSGSCSIGPMILVAYSRLLFIIVFDREVVWVSPSDGAGSTNTACPLFLVEERYATFLCDPLFAFHLHIARDDIQRPVLLQDAAHL